LVDKPRERRMVVLAERVGGFERESIKLGLRGQDLGKNRVGGDASTVPAAAAIVFGSEAEPICRCSEGEGLTRFEPADELPSSFPGSLETLFLIASRNQPFMWLRYIVSPVLCNTYEPGRPTGICF